MVYFQNKLGGEISLPATPGSPEMSFDATMVTVETDGTRIELGRYGVFEIQTMDFHGSYAAAVKNLTDAHRLHKESFPEALRDHPEWAGERMEGPNIANVFKRTFYQMMFKFRIGEHESSAGCVFAIPKAVWDSWQRHLGAPALVPNRDGTWRLAVQEPDKEVSAWIYVFDLDESETESPNSLQLWRVIGTNASSLAHYAINVAPDAALAAGGSVDNIAATIRGRLLPFLPELDLAPEHWTVEPPPDSV
ncbi:PDDEXK family nuclease [Dermacoccus barathri]|uniref:hypothetical protein n=1 Tax=Dermacoccus barathri TaxID=322601 RepID=UPI0029D41084|nr:hypothetical protein [Dermacoccus barathri]